MLSSVYLDAVHKRDATLLALQDSSYKDIVKKAKAGWNEYSPNKVDSKIIGIDASYNSIKYQGLDLWVVTAVAVGADNSVIVDLHDNGLGLMKNNLPLMANRMEIEACARSHDSADLILMDGTIHSKISEDKDGTVTPKIFLKNQNIVFVSKSSDVNDEFGKFGAIAGDIFYYAHASRKAGYSRIQIDKRYGAGYEIVYFYLRLSESQPLLKIELPRKEYTDSDVKKLADHMYKNSIMGYPYSLRLAHENCKISTADMKRFARLHGLGNEIGSREVLN